MQIYVSCVRSVDLAIRTYTKTLDSSEVLFLFSLPCVVPNKLCAILCVDFL